MVERQTLLSSQLLPGHRSGSTEVPLLQPLRLNIDRAASEFSLPQTDLLSDSQTSLFTTSKSCFNQRRRGK